MAHYVGKCPHAGWNLVLEKEWEKNKVLDKIKRVKENKALLR